MLGGFCFVISRKDICDIKKNCYTHCIVDEEKKDLHVLLLVDYLINTNCPLPTLFVTCNKRSSLLSTTPCGNPSSGLTF